MGNGFLFTLSPRCPYRQPLFSDLVNGRFLGKRTSPGPPLGPPGFCPFFATWNGPALERIEDAFCPRICSGPISGLRSRFRKMHWPRFEPGPALSRSHFGRIFRDALAPLSAFAFSTQRNAFQVSEKALTPFAALAPFAVSEKALAPFAGPVCVYLSSRVDPSLGQRAIVLWSHDICCHWWLKFFNMKKHA